MSVLDTLAKVTGEEELEGSAGGATAVTDDTSARDIHRRIHEELIDLSSKRPRRHIEPDVKHIFSSSRNNIAPVDLTLVAAASDGSHGVSGPSTPKALITTAHKKLKALSQQLEYPGDYDLFVAMLSQPEVYDPAGKDMFGLAAIHKLSAWNKPHFLQELCKNLDAKCINDSGGDQNYSCLHFCVEMGALQSLQFFVEGDFSHLIDYESRDCDHKTALDLAIFLNNEKAVQILQPRYV